MIARMMLDLEHRDLQRQMHLRPREPDADVLVHRLDHIVEELLKIVRFDFINRDRLSLGSDDGMTEARDFQNHESISLSI